MKRVLFQLFPALVFLFFSISVYAQEQPDSLYIAGEQKAYLEYANSKTRLDSIQNGMQYVNSYVKRSARRMEVSDRIAYLMASTPEYLNGTSLETMLSYVHKEETREYVISQKNKADRETEHIRKLKSLGFNAGIGGAVETCEYINEWLTDTQPTYGGHLLFSVGDYRNFFNFELGVRYRFWVFRLNHWTGDPNAKYDYDFHQVRLVLAPKFNLIRQKKSAFYFYVAPEFGYNYPIDMHATGYYEGENMTLGARAGLGIGRFEVSASYAHDISPMLKYAFTEAYQPQQVGVAMTIYFSGGGRK